MKKLNRKGFTLVELLAVIIILAIVVGISIPAITNIINDSKNNALGVAVDSAEKYVTDQYAFMNLDDTNTSQAFKDTFNNGADEYNLTSTSNAGILEDMGFNVEDVTTVDVTIDATGKVCVEVQSIPTSSQYYSTEHWDSTSPRDSAKTTSKGC